MVKLIEINNRKNKVLRGVLTLPDNIENPIVVLKLMDLVVLDLIFTDAVKVMESLKR